MSAFIVGEEQIDAIVHAMLTYELTVFEKADETGRMLWAENLASVAYRYPGDVDGDRPGPCDFVDGDVDDYTFTPLPGRVDPEIAKHLARSLDYQSCEHPGWKSSAARALLDHLVLVCDERIPEFTRRFGRYQLDGGSWALDGRDIYLHAQQARAASLTKESA